MACNIEHDDLDFTCTYSVYSLWDGATIDQESFCDYELAEIFLNKLMWDIRYELSTENLDVVEVTVHLYDTVLGEIKREVRVETGNEFAR